MTTKRILPAAVAILVLAASGPAVSATPRSGELHITKECSDYLGRAGDYCTFTSSNLRAIEGGDRIVYAQAAGASSLDTDVAVVAGPGNVAFGHCTLVFASLPGHCTFSGGTGKFTHFHATAAVSVDATGLWHWEGSYSFSPGG